MGKNNQLPQPWRQYLPPGSQQESERFRPRTPAEVVDDSYMAIVQAEALTSVTHLAYDSVKTVAEHKRRVLEEYPEMEAELNALGFNHLQGLLTIQRQVSDNVKREKQ